MFIYRQEVKFRRKYNSYFLVHAISSMSAVFFFCFFFKDTMREDTKGIILNMRAITPIEIYYVGL